MCKHRRAFTLVELLVVIGIIAVLIGILLPALQSARRAAGAVKCAASMREIGNAFQMYAQENKGYAPPGRLYGAATYNLYGVNYNAGAGTADALGAPYWFTFLSKYVTNAKVGSAGQQTAEEAARQLRTVFWGCPAWDPTIANSGANGVGGFFQTQTGYGYNVAPEYTPSYPALGYELGESTGAVPPGDAAAGTKMATPHYTGPGWSKYTWEWYKLNKWTHPAERALVADTVFWVLEARPTPPNTPPNAWKVGEQILDGGPAGLWAGTNGAYRTTFDYYRHGKYPGIDPADTKQFKPNGGKMAFNTLFADGHVVTLTDRPAAYKSVRMRFPG